MDSLDFHVEKAECFGLLGPNGAGKTTSMKIIYGMTEPDADRDTGKNAVIDIFGYSPDNDSLSIKALSGIVPQQDNLDVELNVTDNLLIYSKFYDIPKKEALARIDKFLVFMELKLWQQNENYLIYRGGYCNSQNLNAS